MEVLIENLFFFLKKSLYLAKYRIVTSVSHHNFFFNWSVKAKSVGTTVQATLYLTNVSLAELTGPLGCS